MAEPLVSLQQAGSVARVILDRAAQRNALSTRLCNDLLGVLGQVNRSVRDGSVRAATIEGRGSAFCAGADLKERSAMDPDASSSHSRLIADCADHLAALACPVVACVHGAALGGGLELALACDLRVVAKEASLGFPEVALGFFPGAGGPVRLARLVGISVATHLLMTGRRFNGEEAVAYHIAHIVVPQAEVQTAALDLAGQLASLPPRGLRALKELMSSLDHDTVRHGMARARKLRDELNVPCKPGEAG